MWMRPDDPCSVEWPPESALPRPPPAARGTSNASRTSRRIPLDSTPLLLALGGFEEERQLFQALGAEGGGRRHRRARIDARRAFEVGDLELDAQVARADVGQVRRPQVRA